MNISSVTAGRGVYSSNQNNSEIKMLEKQKEQLVKQLQTTKESEMDSKTKQQVIKDLQTQIQQIESQIQQKRNENLTQRGAENEKSQESSSRTDNTASQRTDDLSNLSRLVEASSSYTKARVLNSVKSSMEGRSGILEQEIKLDEAKGIDPKVKKEELSDIKQKSSQLDQDLGETLKTSKDQAEDGAKAGDAKDKAEETVRKEQSADGENPDIETKENAEEKDNDPLTWLLEHNGQYNPVDVIA